jgi:hypothetical protein
MLDGALSSCGGLASSWLTGEDMPDLWAEGRLPAPILLEGGCVQRSV